MANDDLTGQLLDSRYSILARINRGSYGTLWRSDDTPTDSRSPSRKVLVNVLDLEYSELFFTERLQRSAKMRAIIENMHYVQFGDVGKLTDGRFYSVMRIPMGLRIDAVLQREGCFTADRAVEIIVQLTEALRGLHLLGYVHGEIRPQHIFLNQLDAKADFVTLLDAALIRVVNADLQAASVPDSSPGIGVINATYLSPEYLQLQPCVDQRADVYAVGCVAYEMLTGRAPFVGENDIEILQQHARAQPLPLNVARPGCAPDSLEQIIARMLLKAPELRFSTMSEVVAELQASLG
jgi:serine/threonine protein kinase